MNLVMILMEQHGVKMKDKIMSFLEKYVVESLWPLIIMLIGLIAWRFFYDR